MKKVAIIGTVGIPAKYGGFETLTEYLTKELNTLFDITVYCSKKSYETQLANHNGAKLRYVNFNANGSQSILYDIVSIFDAIKYADTLLILGVSGCIILPLIKLISKKHLIVNIDGLEWKRQKWGKFAKIFLKFSERLAVTFADSVIADNPVIQEYVQSEYKKSSTCIAYGADHVSKQVLSSETICRFPFLSELYAFKVCRIEPENNISMILEAFHDIVEYQLVIVGNWDNSEYGQSLKEKYKEYSHIHLLDPIYDQPVLNQLRSNCAMYLHGHSAGGTNPSLVEAMYLGLPIITYGVNYNRETTMHSAKYFDSSSELSTLVNTITPSELAAIATKMNRIAQENYSWRLVATHYGLLF